MDAETKRTVGARLRRIAGQVQAVERMVDADRYCIDVTHQLAAVQAAIRKVSEVILRPHVQTCVTDAVRSSDERECKREVEELVAVLGRYRRIREQGPSEWGADSCTRRPNIASIDQRPLRRRELTPSAP